MKIKLTASLGHSILTPRQPLALIFRCQVPGKEVTRASALNHLHDSAKKSEERSVGLPFLRRTQDDSRYNEISRIIEYYYCFKKSTLKVYMTVKTNTDLKLVKLAENSLRTQTKSSLK